MYHDRRDEVLRVAGQGYTTKQARDCVIGAVVGRIVKDIEIDGKVLKALFDTGSARSYITAKFRPPVSVRVPPITVGLGGMERRIDERCIISAKIDGLDFDLTAFVVDELGAIEEGKLDAIVGALTMEEWWIKLDPQSRTLDLSQLRRREFTEY